MSMSPSTLSPFKKIAAVAALALGTAFSASAHIPAEHEAMLKEYEDFIMKMTLPNGAVHCCTNKDAYVNSPEERKADGTYVITINTDNDGKKLAEPIKVTIPADKVLSGKHAAEFCKAATAEGSKTCKLPPYGIAWIRHYAGSGQPHVYCYWPRPRMSLGQ